MKMIRYCFLSIMLITLSTNLANATSAISGADSGPAIGGYDVVAYFTEGQATIGKKEFKATYMDAEWLFSSSQNRDLFSAMPAHYAPQYGGYCAYAAALGSTARGNGKYWRIVDNKLYLNNNGLAQSLWQRDIPRNIIKANKKWPSIKKSH